MHAPEPIQGPARIALRPEQVVATQGCGVAVEVRGVVFAGGSTLGDSAPFKTAAGLLEGGKPSFFLDTPQLVKLISAFAGDDESFAKAKPTLDTFGPAAAGISRDGDVTRLKAAVAVP